MNYRSTYRILVIDDDQLFRESLVIYLEDSGFDVIEAADGKAGLEAFNAHLIHLVLCDLRMPGMDGLDVLRHIVKKAPDVPMIAISGAGLMDDVVESLRIGACDYLVKPLDDMIILEHAVSQALRRAQSNLEKSAYQCALEQENAELEQNLTLLEKNQLTSRQVHVQLLPKPSVSLNGLYFDYRSYPSSQLTGDSFDYYILDDRYTILYMADASGHGDASVVINMMLKTLMHQPLRYFRQEKDGMILEPSLMLEMINQEISQANLGKYITLFYAVFDKRQCCFSYALGGYFPRPILFNCGQYQLLEGEGVPAGLFEWSQFPSYHVVLSDDFCLNLFSDGVLECVKTPVPNKEIWLLEQCKRVMHHEEENGLVPLCQQLELESHQPFRDDVSVLQVRFQHV